MGLSINRAPKWEDDSFGYINTSVSILNIYHKLLETLIEKELYEKKINKKANQSCSYGE